MNFKSKALALKPWHLDFFCVAIIVGLNPITHFFNSSTGVFSPDTLAYVVMGRDMFTKGLLYIPSWSHVYNDLIYPPLYPFLIACGSLFTGEGLKVAEWVSSLSALIALIPMYSYLKGTTNRVIALSTLVLIQINYYYCVVGMWPYSEATFLLALSLTLFLTLRLFQNPHGKGSLAVIVGVSCAMASLSRQIGISVFIFLGVFSLLRWLSSERGSGRLICKNFLLISVGFLLVIVPYSITVYLQSGHHPLGQNFRKKGHEVTTTDPGVLAEVRQIESLPERTYGMIYAKRRLMRKLLPDASEMYEYVNLEGSGGSEHLKSFVSSFKNPKDYVTKIGKNIVRLKDIVGEFTLCLFLILCISPFTVKSSRIQRHNRILLPFFIVFYLLLISCVTVQIQRYIYILLPFVLMHIAIELFLCFQTLSDSQRLRPSALLFFGPVYLLIVLVTPKFFTDMKIYPKSEVMRTEFHGLRKHVNGEPVFGLVPLYSYLAGGAVRLLPNDSLEKVAGYGKKTGVRWLLIVRTESTMSELRYYTHAKWYWNRMLEEDYPDLVRFCCGTPHRTVALYEIL